MGLLRRLLLAPVKAPIDGALWITAKIHEAAETEYNDPAAIKGALRTLEDAMLRGDISEAEYDAAEEDLLRRLQAAS